MRIKLVFRNTDIINIWENLGPFREILTNASSYSEKCQTFKSHRQKFQVLTPMLILWRTITFEVLLTPVVFQPGFFFHDYWSWFACLKIRFLSWFKRFFHHYYYTYLFKGLSSRTFNEVFPPALFILTTKRRSVWGSTPKQLTRYSIFQLFLSASCPSLASAVTSQRVIWLHAPLTTFLTTTETKHSLWLFSERPIAYPWLSLYGNISILYILTYVLIRFYGNTSSTLYILIFALPLFHILKDICMKPFVRYVHVSDANV